MPRGLVLVIEDDEGTSTSLARALRDAELDALERRTAKSGLDTACAAEPDAIVCSVDLPDADGYWVARSVRTHPTRVSVTPFLFLAAGDDEATRLQGFHVGGDVTMTKPFRVDEVVAQVRALVKMAERLRHRRESLAAPPPSSSAETAAVEGDVAQMSVATILTVLDMERRTGEFRVVSKKRVAHLAVVGGAIAGATLGGTAADPLEVIRSVLGWTVGRFSFRGRADMARPPELPTIAALLLDAVRLEDEGRRDGVDSRRLWRRVAPPPLDRAAVPSLGGPPASVRETKPPSRSFARAESARPSVDVDALEEVEPDEVLPSQDLVSVRPAAGDWPIDDPSEAVAPARPAVPPPAGVARAVPRPELARVLAPPRPAGPRGAKG